MTRQFGLERIFSIFSKNHPKPEKCEASGSSTSSPHHRARKRGSTDPPGSSSRMTFPRIVLLLCLAIGARAAHPRSPENCFCETWSLGNALGALGGSQTGADFRPGTSYTGGKKVTSAGNNCVSWMQVSPTPATRPNVPCRTPIPPNPDPRLTNGGQSTRPTATPVRTNHFFPPGFPR